MRGASTRDRYGMLALGFYLALSMLFFGRGLVGHFATRHLGKAVGDPALVAWFFCSGWATRSCTA
jgi:NhaP-type Na+/H+ and K+/H+ antiporter